MKQNCWEIMGCGREPNGKNVIKLGVCPAATELRLNNVHGGKAAGRACWIVAGTYCKGEIQGTFGKKFKECKECKMYKKVKDEENSAFMLSGTLLARLK